MLNVAVSGSALYQEVRRRPSRSWYYWASWSRRVKYKLCIITDRWVELSWVQIFVCGAELAVQSQRRLTMVHACWKRWAFSRRLKVLSDSSGARNEGGRLFQVAGPNTANLRWPVDVQTLGKKVYKQTKLSIVVRVIAPLSIRPHGALCTADYCASTIIFLPLQEIWVVTRAWRNVIGHPTAGFMFNITRRLRLTTQYWNGISSDPYRTDEC